MNQDVDRAKLFCAGCGNCVARLPRPGEMLAISCRCGAYSPILIVEELLTAAEPVSTTLPGSLHRIIQVWKTIRSTAVGVKPPSISGHWENHLGPEPQTIVGKAWKTYLVEIGLTSMADCVEERCQRGIQRMRAGR